MTKRVLTSTNLLINQSFALRQRDGMPVFTKIGTSKRPYSELEINDIINNLNKQRRVNGLTICESFDVEYKEMIRKTDKKSRIKTDYPIDLHSLERIILTPNAKGYISTAFLDFTKEHNISIYWINARGKIEMSLMPFNYKKPSLVVKQAEARLNGKDIEIAKYLIRLKLESQGIEYLIPHLEKCKDIKNVLTIEGTASSHYYKKWSFSEEWHWTGRHGKNIKENTNAVDPINVMLNFGFGLLVQRMSETLLKRGFELSIGFLHLSELNNVYNMLAYDFIEPYRVWIDNCVKQMITEKEIKPSDFTFVEDKSHIVFKDKALDIVLNRFMDTLELLEFKSRPVLKQVERML